VRGWLAGAVVAGCHFTPGALTTGDAPGISGDTGDIDSPVEIDAACPAPAWTPAYAHRFPITTNAPAGFTLTIDVTAPRGLALTSGDDLRVFADATELDRVLTGNRIEVKVPASGSLFLYVGDPAAGTPPSAPANVYLASASFDELAVGDHADVTFDPQPALEWNVVDDSGNHVYRAQGSGRHPSALRGVTQANADLRARMRIVTGGGQQHNGLAARGNSMVPATMDGFVMQMLGDSNYQRIAEYTNGASPPVELTGGTVTVTRDIWYAMRLRIVGDALELYVDNVLARSTTKTGSDGQLVGLFAHDCVADFDDVTLRMAVAPEPTVALGAREDRCP
jgi:hypothetical protein